jgi:hypothetical protein
MIYSYHSTTHPFLYDIRYIFASLIRINEVEFFEFFLSFPADQDTDSEKQYDQLQDRRGATLLSDELKMIGIIPLFLM